MCYLLRSNVWSYGHLFRSLLVSYWYSKEEHAYDDDIKYFIKDLDDNNIAYDDRVETFVDHGEVGKYFLPCIKNELEKLINNG